MLQCRWMRDWRLWERPWPLALDPNLDSLRTSPKFKTLIDSYDEPVINDNAIK